MTALLVVLLLATTSAEAFFPSVLARNSGTNATQVTDHVLTLPSGTQANDTVYFNVTFDNGALPTVTWPTGWSNRHTNVCGGGVDACSGANRSKVISPADVATGTVTVTTSAGRRSSWVGLRILNAHIGGSSTGSSTSGGGTPDLASLGCTLTQDYLWLGTVNSDGRNDGMVAPTNYSNMTQTTGPNWNVGDGIRSGTFERQLRTATEDPGAMGSGGWNTTLNTTVCLQPRKINMGARRGR